MTVCRYCSRKGEWPSICMNTRDMEDRVSDALCHSALMRVGGGEYSENQRLAANGELPPEEKKK